MLHNDTELNMPLGIYIQGHLGKDRTGSSL